jgi:hypothetical protein
MKVSADLSNASPHSEYRDSSFPILPRRVLDLQDLKASGSVKLHLSSSDERSQYVSLSYCWGLESQPTTTTGNYKARIDKIAFRTLSETVQNAIEVTQKLGIRFLWVDALCIIQDDAQDKAREIDGMGEIYRNASLTIAAGNSPSAQEGFLATEPLLKPWKLSLLLPDGFIGNVMVVPRHPFPSGGHKSRHPLNSRGWAFQEYILSTRVLFFGCGDVWWRCQRMTLEPLLVSSFTSSMHDIPTFQHSENFETQRTDPDISLKPSISQRIWQPSEKRLIWERIIQAYSSRKLRDIGDRLPALAGIAARLGALWKDNYLAGLWESFLMQQLSWYKMVPDDLPLGGVYLAPTWSWASVDGAVMLREVIGSIDVEIRDCKVDCESTKAQFGKVKSRTLTLLAPVVPWLSMRGPIQVLFDHRYRRNRSKETVDMYESSLVLMKSGTRKVATLLLAH